jgi:uncharacterized protein YndB with AHSA1/START domain
MLNKLTATNSITIHAAPEKVWKALTDPEQIRQYLFGTTASSDWQKGSPITYRGEWEGKSYEDKGRIVDIVPLQLLHTTYWSGMGGKEDKPENYANVIYTLKPENGHTFVTITQDNIENEAGVQHMNENWTKVLEGMKRLLER